ncbi:AMP-binding protein [Kurthia sp. Dielmo]|uniref:AMP-binding protein n=1 Tax=Kurthia sp. Dielmo TaxID=1033738 RepID=UPI00111D5407|nr:AMP-binding protein [Kurthia sp. Dielmo]
MYETLLTDAYKTKYKALWKHKTILDYLQEAIDKAPQKTAIIDSKSRYTYAQLGQAVDRVALGLKHYGIQKGDIVSIQLPNWNEFVILHYAITKIGAVTNPLIPIYREREIGYMVPAVQSKALIIPDSFRGFSYAEMIDSLRTDWDFLEHIFVIGEQIPRDMHSFDDLLKKPWEEDTEALAALNAQHYDADDVTEIIFTSGTTGNPKGVMHTHNTLCVSTDYWVKHLALQEDDVFLMASTFAHQTGFCYGVRLPTHYAGTAVYQDVWDIDEFLRLIEREKVTFTAGATPFLQDMLSSKQLADYDLSTFRAFVALGAPIPRALIREAQENEHIQFQILSGWGQTENGLVTLTELDDSEEKLVNTDGHALPGMSLAIVDASFKELPRNEEGSLLVKGPALFVGYLNQLDKTIEEHHGDWFITGDLAVMDDDGYIRISGRSKDIIIRGGENIPVAYVENVLYEHPDIFAAQIVAMPDPRLQERAAAIVMMNNGCTPITFEALQDFLTTKGLAKHYWPEYLEVVDDFPRTASGKIQKFKLREMIQDKTAEGGI